MYNFLFINFRKNRSNLLKYIVLHPQNTTQKLLKENHAIITKILKININILNINRSFRQLLAILASV